MFLSLQLPLVGRGAQKLPEIAREAGYGGKAALAGDQIHWAVAAVHHAAGFPDANGVEIVNGRHVDVFPENTAKMRL